MTMLGISVGGFACVSSMASQVVPRAQTGEAQGVITSLKALTEGLGPLATAAALPWFEGTPLPGAPAHRSHIRRREPRALLAARERVEAHARGYWSSGCGGGDGAGHSVGHLEAR